MHKLIFHLPVDLHGIFIENRNMNKPLIILAVVVGIIFLGIAGIYFVTPANHLPHFFPGFDSTLTKTHYKHGIGALVIAIAAFIFAWFQSGKKKTSSDTQQKQ